MATIEIRVPDIGDFKDVAVIELLVKPGDAVAVEQSLITVESDKASMEIPSSQAGVVQSLAVKIGDTVNQGSLILTLEAAGAPVVAAASPAARRRRLPRQPLRRRHPPRRPLRRRSLRGLPTTTATCWCSAPAPAATRRRSARPTSA